MIEHVIREAAHRFRACDGCGRQPLHIEIRGRTALEAAARPTTPCQRHQLECAACGRRTARYASLALAEQEWGVKYAVLPLALPMRGRRAAA